MPSSHAFFIPAVLLVGFVLGYIYGGKTVRDRIEAARKRARE
jgi:hypothetical protein